MVHDDEFPTAWRARAASFVAGPKVAIGQKKQNIFDASRLPLPDALRAQGRLQVESSRAHVHREAFVPGSTSVSLDLDRSPVDPLLTDR